MILYRQKLSVLIHNKSFMLFRCLQNYPNYIFGAHSLNDCGSQREIMENLFYLNRPVFRGSLDYV